MTMLWSYDSQLCQLRTPSTVLKLYTAAIKDSVTKSPLVFLYS